MTLVSTYRVEHPDRFFWYVITACQIKPDGLTHIRMERHRIDSFRVRVWKWNVAKADASAKLDALVERAERKCGRS